MMRRLSIFIFCRSHQSSNHFVDGNKMVPTHANKNTVTGFMLKFAEELKLVYVANSFCPIIRTILPYQFTQDYGI